VVRVDIGKHGHLLHGNSSLELVDVGRFHLAPQLLDSFQWPALLHPKYPPGVAVDYLRRHTIKET
jgi:hypothetical protein